MKTAPMIVQYAGRSPQTRNTQSGSATGSISPMGYRLLAAHAAQTVDQAEIGHSHLQSAKGGQHEELPAGGPDP